MAKFKMGEEVIYHDKIGGVYPVNLEYVVFGIKKGHFKPNKVTYAIYDKEIHTCKLVDEKDLIKKDDFDE